MRNPRANLDPEGVLARQPGLLRLARRLVGDAQLSEDVVQQAWLVAISHSTPGVSDGWLCGVVRHLAARLLRGERRRQRRESEAMTPGEAEDALSAVSRLEAQRRVTDALRALPEPYRSTLVERYFDGALPSEIARRRGLPIATVKSRLRRGLAGLRTALDAGYGGDRGAWCAGVIGLGAWRRGAVVEALALGTITMTTRLGVLTAAAALSVAALGLVSWAMGDGMPPAAPRRVATSDAAGVTLELPVPVCDRVEAGGPAAAPAPVPDAGLAAVVMHGRVLDGDGKGVVGVVLGGRDGEDEVVARSGAGGVFELRRPRSRILLGARDPYYQTVFAATVPPGVSQLEPLVVVAPRIRLAGHVRRRDRSLIEGAEVRQVVGEAVLARLAVALESSRGSLGEARTAADGSFALDRAAALPGARLRVTAGEEFEPLEVDAPQRSQELLELVLEPRDIGDRPLRGRVFDAAGVPAPGVDVVLGRHCTRSRTDGAFELDRRGVSAGTRLLAIAAGSLPAVLEDPAGPGGARPGWPPYVELVLGGPPLSVAGRVVGPSGEPVVGAMVWIDDLTYACITHDRPGWVETMIAGRRFPREGTTGENGDFELGGMLARRYRIGVFDSATWRRACFETVAGDHGLVLRLPSPARVGGASGRVVDRHGTPVPGVSVSLSVVYRRLSAPGAAISQNWYSTDVAVSDAAGRFAIPSGPARPELIRYTGDSVMPGSRPVDAAEVLSSLQLVVPRRCNLQVIASGSSGDVSGVVVLGKDGTKLALMRFRDRQSSGSMWLPLVDGASAVVAVSDAAAELLVYRGTTVVRRQPVVLRPGVLNRVEVE